MRFLHYGLQRTGTNYLNRMVLANFRGVQFLNGEIRSTPIHKHFRLYDDKSFVPEPKYANELHFVDFNAFKSKINGMLGLDPIHFIVIVKNPYSWYLSITRMAKSLGWQSFDPKKLFQQHYIQDFNLFYEKWKMFEIDAPKEIKIVKYEDFLTEPNHIMEELRTHFDLNRKKNWRYYLQGGAGKYRNVNRVPNSKNWNVERKKYYLNHAYLEELGEKKVAEISRMIDPQLMQYLDYEVF